MNPQTINLINAEKSEVKYRIVNFPDGEQHLVLESELDHKRPAQVITRIASPDDLFILMQAGDILNRHGVQMSLFIPYLMGMRMDRVTSFNEAFSLKIIADCINSLNPTHVVVVEPHSEATTQLIKNCQGLYMNIFNAVQADNICFPDDGADKRYAPQFQNGAGKFHILYCTKKRDPETGKLSGFELCNPDDYQGGSIAVVDDLCDGGGTFAGIATALRDALGDETDLSIFVTHMVNPKGIKTLSEHYSKVSFSDSYKDWSTEELPENVTLQKAWS